MKLGIYKKLSCRRQTVRITVSSKNLLSSWSSCTQRTVYGLGRDTVRVEHQQNGAFFTIIIIIIYYYYYYFFFIPLVVKIIIIIIIIIIIMANKHKAYRQALRHRN